MPLCFAYGSNMDRAAMAARCPAARVLGLARLARHRLAIMREGYLTVAPDPQRTVHGLLWDVPLAAMPALDRYEEVGHGLYTKRRVAVRTASGGPRRALVYLGANRGPGIAHPRYLELVLQAAVSLALPETAIAEIMALSGQPGRTRGLSRRARRPARAGRAAPARRARIPATPS